MVLIRRSFAIIFSLFIMVAIAACGSTSTGTGSTYGGGNTTSTTQTSTGSTQTSTGSSCGRYCTGVTPTTSSSGSAVSIKTATMTVQGKTVTVLTNAQGMTLYYRVSDTASSVCDSNGGCSSAWPPLLSSSVPSSSNSLPGKLSVQTDANGSQVQYNGHFLYRYSGDTAPGQANGEGFGNIWFVATTDLTA